jgi:hypothetical protein
LVIAIFILWGFHHRDIVTTCEFNLGKQTVRNPVKVANQEVQFKALLGQTNESKGDGEQMTCQTDTR